MATILGPRTGIVSYKGAFNPSDYITPVQWTRAIDVVGANNAPVGLAPFNTYGTDATATSTMRPLLQTSVAAINNQQSFLLDGIDDFLTLGTPIVLGTGDGCVFVVYKKTAAATQCPLLGSNTATGYIFFLYDGTVLTFVGAQSVIEQVNWVLPDDSNWHLISLTKSGTTLELFFDGASQGTRSLSNAISSILFIGKGAVPVFSGQIAEVLIGSDAPSLADRESLEDLYYAPTYGLTLAH